MSDRGNCPDCIEQIAARQKQKARRIALGAREISLQKTATLRAVVRAALGETK